MTPTIDFNHKQGAFAMVILCLFFIIYKSFFLPLPYFWDESWVYSKAIYAMAESGPSLLPGSIDPNLYTGHPLMFYCLSSIWVKTFGAYPAAAHVFPIILACILFLVIYILTTKISNPFIGLLSAIVVAVQPITLAQSGMLLAEILLSIFTFSAVYFYIKNKTFPMVVCLSRLILTKEAGLVMVGLLSLITFIETCLAERKINLPLIKKVLLLLVPFFFGFGFYFLQKLRLGWFFFPRHTGWIDLTFETVSNKFIDCATFVFWKQGRWLLSVIMVLGLIKATLSWKEIPIHEKRIIRLLLLFIPLYLLFCAVNFLSTRYVYCTIPALIILFAWSFYTLFSSTKVQLIFASIIIISSPYAIKQSYSAGISDIDLCYVNMVQSHQQMVQYCEQKKLYNTSIATHFLMIEQLTNKSCGYLANQTFTQVSSKVSAETAYLIISPIEQEFNLEELRKIYNIELEKRFENGNAWCEIYSVRLKSSGH